MRIIILHVVHSFEPGPADKIPMQKVSRSYRSQHRSSTSNIVELTFAGSFGARCHILFERVNRSIQCPQRLKNKNWVVTRLRLTSGPALSTWKKSVLHKGCATHLNRKVALGASLTAAALRCPPGWFSSKCSKQNCADTSIDFVNLHNVIASISLRLRGTITLPLWNAHCWLHKWNTSTQPWPARQLVAKRLLQLEKMPSVKWNETRTRKKRNISKTLTSMQWLYIHVCLEWCCAVFSVNFNWISA